MTLHFAQVRTQHTSGVSFASTWQSPQEAG